LPDEANVSASHVVTWGQVSTCNDSSYFTGNDMILSCSEGVILRIDNVTNAKCQPVVSSNSSRVSCQFNGQVENQFAATYQRAVATAIFSCIGENGTDLVATAQLPNSLVTNCSGTAPSNNSTRKGRRLLRSLSSDAASRSVRSALGGNASAFISMGRFCRDGDDNATWTLWNQLYPCESGRRMLITALGSIWNGNLPDFDSLLSENTTNLFAGLIDPPWLTARLQSFCYNVGTTSNNTDSNSSDSCGNESCNFQVRPIRILDSDPRTSCVSPLDDVPSLQDMWNAVEEDFNSFKFIDLIANKLQ
jgi:hypothetical protein